VAGLRIAVAGATGLVGRAILKALEADSTSDWSNITLLASARSAGGKLSFRGNEHEVRLLDDQALKGCDLVFFSAGAEVSRRFVPIAVQYARWVIDNSSAFRTEPDVPLVVPEVNGQVLEDYSGLIANPNCSTIQLVVALQPLHAAFELESVVVSTYQSVSGSGRKGLRALEHELETSQRHPESPYPHPIAHQVLPQVDVIDTSGWSGEEKKMIFETRKIMGLPGLHVVPTSVRVPVRVGHSESIYARFRQPVDPTDARRVLASAPGIVVQDEPEDNVYPLARNVEGRDEVFVGRIRQLEGDNRSLCLWVVADNVRKGAAGNAIQIAKLVAGQSVASECAHV
jgi:aspartate-semialdehyde dehydrogenase